MQVAGVDEAGRGPLLGPMVIAIASISREKEELLVRMGVRDSKALTPSRRRALRALLERVLDYYAVRVVEPAEVDEAVSKGQLNLLEARIIAELVRQAASEVELEVVYVDSPDPVPERFERLLTSLIGEGVRVVAENGADAKYVVVGAASIIAKTERDRIVEELKRKYGDFGSGYPSDPKT
ncbi:MAG: ribonuclease HII, partial [Thermofilaceae archaeon]